MTETKPFILLNFDGKDYKYRLTLNGIIELQERTGLSLEDPEELTRKIKSDLKLVRIIIWLGIKAYDEKITEEAVGAMIDMSNFEATMKKIFQHIGMVQVGEPKNERRAVKKKIPSRGTGKPPSKQPAKSVSPRGNSTI